MRNGLKFVILVAICFVSITKLYAFGMVETKSDDEKLIIYSMMAIQQKMGSLKEGETISRFEIIDNQVTLRTVLAKASVSSGKTRYLGFIAVNEPSRELLIEQLNIQTEPLPKWLGVASDSNTKAHKLVKAGSPNGAFEIDLHYHNDPGTSDVIEINGHPIPVYFDRVEFTESDYYQYVK
ncbi:MAG: hypothetical protein MK137_01925 [Rickettsiales bacterium]|nr:hypothetical protein [Rickettsiales bacterium]